MSKTKQQTLLLFVAAAGILMFLAMGLPDLQLLPGQPFSLEESQPAERPDLSNLTIDSEVLAWLLRGMLALLVVMLPFYIIYSLSSKAGRRRLIAQVVTLMLLLYVADHLREMAQDGAFGDPEGLMAQSGPLQDALESAPVAIFAPDPPQWLTLAIILVTAVLLVAMAALIIWIVQRSRKVESPFDQLADEAQTALESLSTGANFQETITRCYHEMSRVLQEERGIARTAAMTPREFEDRLIGRGLPGDAIKTLTRLFEQVRYGSLNANPGEEDQAVECLTTIVDYCRTLENHSA